MAKLGLLFGPKTHIPLSCSLICYNAMKLLGNSLHSILSLQQNIHSPHYTLWLPTVVFNGAPVIKNLKELSKIQRRAALWITGAFHTSSTEGVKAIVGLIPIFLYLRKLNG